MEYTKEILKEWAVKIAPSLPLVGNDLDRLASAWEQEVAELRELCKLLNQHANKFDFEGAGSEDEKRVNELWAKHITKHMKGGEG